jgi:hypothetical protein
LICIDVDTNRDLGLTEEAVRIRLAQKEKSREHQEDSVSLISEGIRIEEQQ